MAIEFTCPACGGTLRVEDRAVGQVVRCGGCLTMLRVPDTASLPPDPMAFPDAPPTPFPDTNPPRPLPRASRVDQEPTPTATPAEEPPPVPRRRRRVRREVVRPKGYGPVFWIAITFGLLGLGAFACCGGFFLILPGAKWRSHESSEGGFKVDLPAAPLHNLATRAVRLNPNMKVEGTRLIRRAEEFLIVYGSIPSTRERKDNDEDELARAVKSLETAPEVQAILENKQLMVCGFPASEIVFRGKDGGTYVSRVVIADSRLYFLVAGGPMSRSGNPNARQFLDSFEITDPKLRELAAKRAEQAKNAALGAAEARKRTEARRRQEEAEAKEAGILVGRATADAISAALDPP